MAVIERTYTIPLRKEWMKAPKYKRAKKAVTGVRNFLERHMKADENNIRLGKYLNEELWKHGIKNPPPRIRINVRKDDKGLVTAELAGAPVEKKESKEKKKPAKKQEKKEAELQEAKETVEAETNLTEAREKQ